METVDTVLEEPSDLDQLAFEPANSKRRFQGFADQVGKDRVAGRCIFAKVGGLDIRSHFLRGEEKLLMDMLADEAFCEVLFDRGGVCRDQSAICYIGAGFAPRACPSSPWMLQSPTNAS